MAFHHPMRIFTCTPVAFGGGADFFTRDSGLLCRGFQSIGIESRAVMAGKRMPDDEADLIRTDYRNLESADWWRAQKADGVVLYAWGRPRFRKVAAAIHDAGIFLVLNQDSGGLASPLAGLRDWLHAQWIYGGQGRGLMAWLRSLFLMTRGLTAGLFVTDPLRAMHLKQGDVIACVSPKAAEHYRLLCRFYGGESLAKKVRVLPHGVESLFRFSGREKRHQVACVGRWHGSDEIQKRATLLMEVVAGLLKADKEVTVAIAGRSSTAMAKWHAALDDLHRSRVRLAGRMAREELADLLDQSQVFYSPSAYESFGIAAAEALCSGCSVVAARKLTLPSFGWFVSEDSGRLAEQDNVAGHVASLLAELKSWKSGERDAAGISRVWCDRLHADKVAEMVAGMAL